MPLTAYIFLSAAQRRLLRTGFGVYVFHKIAVPPAHTRDPFEYTTAAELERKLEALQVAGFQPATIGAAEQAPPGNFAVTFDDGYANVAEQALPVLQRQNIRAIEFIVAGKLGGQNDWDIAKGDTPERLMDEAQVKTWLAAGHQIGSHSLTHPNLRKITPTAAREEITASKKKLEDTFGVPVEHFCYPYGSSNEAVRDMVTAAGYRTASSVKFGVHSPAAPRLELKRLPPLTTRELWRKILHRLRRRW